MKKICCLFILFIFALSCKKDSPTAISGNYAGTYTYTFGPIDSIATIRINFDGERFNGESDNPGYPGICEGSYGIDGDNIQFGNDCYVPGDSLHRMVLYGDYGIIQEGDSLIFGRTYGNFVLQSEFYRLKKQ